MGLWTSAAGSRGLARRRGTSYHGVRGMHITQQKEQFSIAFVRALATVAGFRVTRCEVDDDSIDVGLAGNRRQGRTQRAPHLDLQLKCTETDDGTGEELVFDLPIKNYNDLRIVEVHVPAILVVVCVPPDVGEWLDESPEQTAMRRCAYWLSLRGSPSVANESTRRVRMPRSNQFNVAAVRAIMTRIGEGGLP